MVMGLVSGTFFCKIIPLNLFRNCLKNIRNFPAAVQMFKGFQQQHKLLRPKPVTRKGHLQIPTSEEDYDYNLLYPDSGSE